MSLRRLLKSMAWKLFPYAGLDARTPGGLALSIRDKGEWWGVREIFIERVYTPFFEPLKDVRGWVDVGCNVGYFSLALEDHLRRLSGGTIESTSALLIDANDDCLRSVNDSLQRNRLSHWQTRHGLIGPAGETVRFNQFRFSIHSKIAGNQAGEKVLRYPTSSLEDLLEGFPGPLDLIKIDIEGAEADLLKQEPEVLKRFRYGICEWHDPFLPGPELADFCRSAGFEINCIESNDAPEERPADDPLQSRYGMIGWRNPKVSAASPQAESAVQHPPQ